MTHHSFTPKSIPCAICSIDNLSGCVPQTQIEGLRTVSEIFRAKGVRHAVVGGLAVGANGYLRNTNNLDFLVDDNAFLYSDKVVYVRNDLPIKYFGSRVNWVSMSPSEKPIFGNFLMLPARDQVPIMPVEPLIAMKLIAGRHKDRTDIIELAKVRSDLSSIREFTSTNIPHLLPLLDALIVCAEEEK
jgi:hypothetical protein